MRTIEKSTRRSSFDLIKEAIETGGYPYELEREGDCLEMKVLMPGTSNLITTMRFGPDGEVMLPNEVQDLIRRGRVARKRPKPPEPPCPDQEGFRASIYDMKHGTCSETGPCPGLQALMAASCVQHGGIIGMVDDPHAEAPDYVGFVPSPDHRDGHMLVFNFCPCCGFDLRAGLENLCNPATFQ